MKVKHLLSGTIKDNIEHYDKVLKCYEKETEDLSELQLFQLLKLMTVLDNIYCLSKARYIKNHTEDKKK